MNGLQQLLQSLRASPLRLAAAAAALVVVAGLGVAAYLVLRPPTAGVLPLGPSDFVPGEVLVKFKPGAAAADVENAHAAGKASKIGEIAQIGVQHMKLPPGTSVGEAVNGYKNNPNVEFAEPNFLTEATQTAPNDQFLAGGLQWAPAKVSAAKAWAITQGSAAVKIAILDSGILTTHPDLTGKVTASMNFSSATTTNDVANHGTHVAGIAAAVTNNSAGVAGIGYNSTLLNVKVLDDTGGGTTASVSNGITWAADNGAKVINMSLGSTTASSTMQAAVTYAQGKGIILVAAAGNNTSTAPFYPAAYPGVIGVAATNSTDALLPSSNTGSWVAVAAPGGQIYSTINSGSYAALDGTSMASPHVAGLAALALAVNPSAATVAGCIKSGADPITATGVGSGRINAYNTVTCAGGGTAAAVPTPTTSTAASPTPTTGTTAASPTPTSGTAAQTVASPTTATAASPTTAATTAPAATATPAPVTSSFTGSVAVSGTTTANHTITLTRAGAISASLNWGGNLNNNKLNLLLLDPAGAQVGSATGARPEVINFNATATGAYTLRVVAALGSGSYTLSVTSP